MSALSILAAIRYVAQALAALFGFARQVEDTAQTERDIEAGRAEANSDTLRQQAERVKQANEAEIEGNAAHIRPDDSAFDPDFKRD